MATVLLSKSTHTFLILHERAVWRLNVAFGLSRIARPAYPVWPTSNFHSITRTSVKHIPLLTHLKFENRPRPFRSRNL